MTSRPTYYRRVAELESMGILCITLSVFTLAAATAAMSLRKPVHCALALTGAFAGLAALYIALGAQFAGLAQLLIYAGAVAILIVFAILLTPNSLEAETNPRQRITRSALSGVFLGAAVFAALAMAIAKSRLGTATPPAPKATVQQIGSLLMQRYLLPLELIGLLLTAALIGAVILALKETQAPR